jgi:hypothetical protein
MFRANRTFGPKIEKHHFLLDVDRLTGSIPVHLSSALLSVLWLTKMHIQIHSVKLRHNLQVNKAKTRKKKKHADVEVDSKDEWI